MANLMPSQQSTNDGWLRAYRAAAYRGMPVGQALSIDIRLYGLHLVDNIRLPIPASQNKTL